jgi:hypothetical protein
MKLETQVVISKELDFIDSSKFKNIDLKIIELVNMVDSFVSKFKN